MTINASKGKEGMRDYGERRIWRIRRIVGNKAMERKFCEYYDNVPKKSCNFFWLLSRKPGVANLPILSFFVVSYPWFLALPVINFFLGALASQLFEGKSFEEKWEIYRGLLRMRMRRRMRGGPLQFIYFSVFRFFFLNSLFLRKLLSHAPLLHPLYKLCSSEYLT